MPLVPRPTGPAILSVGEIMHVAAIWTLSRHHVAAVWMLCRYHVAAVWTLCGPPAAGWDGTIVDRIADGPQRGGEGDAAAGS